MGLFDFLKKDKTTLRCVRCSKPLSDAEARYHDGKAYCVSCQPRTVSGSGSATIDAINSARSGSTGNSGGNGSTNQFNHSGNSGNNGNIPMNIQEVRAAFDKAGLKHELKHIGDQWELIAGVNGKANTYQVKFIAKDHGNSGVGMRIFGLARYPQNRRQAGYRMLNQFQHKYRYLRFTLDNDGDVNVEYDFPDCTTDSGSCAVELMLRTMKIIDEVYPEIMRTLWN